MAHGSRVSGMIALTIAGSDNTGGAGLQADLRTFHAHGVYGLSVATAITSQNSSGVQSVFPVPTEQVQRQLYTLMDDFSPRAAKTGMLASSETARIVAGWLRQHPVPLVVDPVLKASDGTLLSEKSLLTDYTSLLFPLATVITPNIPETEILTGISISNQNDVQKAAAKLRNWTNGVIVIKGGHWNNGDPVDFVFSPGLDFQLSAKRLPYNVHGTGCIFASGIAAGIAKGSSPLESILQAKHTITRGIAESSVTRGGMRYIPL